MKFFNSKLSPNKPKFEIMSSYKFKIKGVVINSWITKIISANWNVVIGMNLI